MLRPFLILVFCGLLASCASTSGGNDSLLRRAQADAALKSESQAYAQFAIARYASLTDDPEIAAQKYARVAERSPLDTVVVERAVFSALLIGDTTLATDLSERIPADTLRETELPRLMLAAKATKDGDTLKAISYLQDPWRSTFHATLARSMLAWGAYESDAEAAIRLQALAADKDPVLSGVTQTLAAIMQLSSGDRDGAQQALNTLWDAQIRLAIGAEALARLMALSGNENGALARIKRFQDTVGRNPSLTQLAKEIKSGELPPPASLTYQQGSALAFYAATAALSGQNNSDLPGVYFAMALYLDPSLDSAKSLWADTLDMSGRRDEAMALLGSIPKTSIYHTSAQGQLAWALRREGDNDRALKVAQKTLEKTEDRNIRIQLADLLQSLGRDGQAETTLTDVIDSDARDGVYDWRIYFARGAARERLGQWPPAESDLKTALGLAPKNPTIMNYLGYGWIDRGINLDDGLELIESALILDPRNGSITDSLGWAHYKLGNYDRAIFYLERATELEPQSAEILDHLGDAYWQVGRYTEAGYQWLRALRYSEDEETSGVIEKKLNGGFALLTASSQTDRPSTR